MGHTIHFCSHCRILVCDIPESVVGETFDPLPLGEIWATCPAENRVRRFVEVSFLGLNP